MARLLVAYKTGKLQCRILQSIGIQADTSSHGRLAMSGADDEKNAVAKSSKAISENKRTPADLLNELVMKGGVIGNNAKKKLLKLNAK